ncbi:terpenoid synthase [Imleria badia]|nr:terpenoid synthase [Imleria badia]
MLPVSSTSKTASTTIILPDLISYCMFDLHTNRNHKLVFIESNRWLLNGDPDLDEAARRAFHALKAGTLAAMSYSRAGYPLLRVCSVFVNWIFHLENLSDDMDNHGIDNVANVVTNSIHHPHTYRSPARLNRITKHFYKRIMQTAAPGACQRFQEGFEFFIQAVQQQALDRDSGTIPDLESRSPNDLATWSNDIYSYDLEQSKGQTHNMIDVIMHEKGLDRANLPSWGPAIDADVCLYVDGLARWMVGSLHWSFETVRYFGKAGKQVKATRLVTLRPRTV